MGSEASEMSTSCAAGAAQVADGERGFAAADASVIARGTRSSWRSSRANVPVPVPP
jgi:hypothetical protein